MYSSIDKNIIIRFSMCILLYTKMIKKNNKIKKNIYKMNCKRCDDCNGTGKVIKTYRCYNCIDGKMLDTNSLIFPHSSCTAGCNNGYVEKEENCSPCNGTGKIYY